MADTQRQRGGRVRLQNTAQQIRLHAVLLFWLKTDLRSDLRALNCEKFSTCPHMPLTSISVQALTPKLHSCPLLALIKQSRDFDHTHSLTSM